MQSKHPLWAAVWSMRAFMVHFDEFLQVLLTRTE